MEVSALKLTGGVGVYGRSPLLRLQSDERLIALVRRGNAGAFEVLHSRYQARLLAFARHMLRSREDAEDVVQEVFTAAHTAILADERPINARPWLYRIARNRCLNHMRRAQAVGVESMDLELADFGASTADKAHRREEFRLLLEDIGELPETQRTALVLRELEALSYEQIAEAMETTVPSVKSLLVRARISLAEAAEARLITCDEVRAELGEHAEGLIKRTSPPVRRHLRFCKRCAAFQAHLKRTNRQLAAIMPVGGLLVLVRRFLVAHFGHSAGSSAASGSAAGGTAAAGAAGTGAVATGSTAALGGGSLFGGGVVAAAVKGALAVSLVAAGAEVAAHVPVAPHRAKPPAPVASAPLTVAQNVPTVPVATAPVALTEHAAAPKRPAVELRALPQGRPRQRRRMTPAPVTVDAGPVSAPVAAAPVTGIPGTTATPGPTASPDGGGATAGTTTEPIVLPPSATTIPTVPVVLPPSATSTPSTPTASTPTTSTPSVTSTTPTTTSAPTGTSTTPTTPTGTGTTPTTTTPTTVTGTGTTTIAPTGTSSTQTTQSSPTPTTTAPAGASASRVGARRAAAWR